jgi:hypothetical protein
VLLILDRQKLILERLLPIPEEDQRLERLLFDRCVILLGLVVVHIEVAVKCFTDFDQEDLLAPDPEGVLKCRKSLIAHNSIHRFVHSYMVPRQVQPCSEALSSLTLRSLDPNDFAITLSYEVLIDALKRKNLHRLVVVALCELYPCLLEVPHDDILLEADEASFGCAQPQSLSKHFHLLLAVAVLAQQCENCTHSVEVFVLEIGRDQFGLHELGAPVEEVLELLGGVHL